jgi:ketosteroid isomerase-like protein
MSHENVEIVRQVREAFMRGDWDTAIAAYDQAVELDMTRMPGGGIYSGPDGVRTFFAGWVGSWDGFRLTPVELIDCGDEVIGIQDITATGKASGATVKMRSADVFRIAGGKVVRHVGYPDASEALEAVGLGE